MNSNEDLMVWWQSTDFTEKAYTPESLTEDLYKIDRLITELKRNGKCVSDEIKQDKQYLIKMHMNWLPFMDVKVNDILYTKDGRSTGNGIVIKECNEGQDVIVKTDYGNEVTISKSRLGDYFTTFRKASKTHKNYVHLYNYNVRLEFDVKSIDLLNVEVIASSEEEARRLAIEKYNENPDESACYASDYLETSLRSHDKANWIVDKEES